LRPTKRLIYFTDLLGGVGGTVDGLLGGGGAGKGIIVKKIQKLL